MFASLRVLRACGPGITSTAARAAAAQAAALQADCRWYSNQTTVEEPSPSTSGSIDSQGTGLPLPQRCKNILGGNWRAQLSTIRREISSPTNPVLSSLVSFVTNRGWDPVVLLDSAQDDDHIKNLAQYERVSMTAGHTDPAGLVSLVRATGRLPPRVNMLGSLFQMPANEVLHSVQLAHNQTAKAVPRGAALPSLQQVTDGRLLGYRFEPMRCQFVDSTGSTHEVALDEVEGAFLDPLAPWQLSLLERVRGDPGALLNLRLFCAGYLQVPVHHALMLQADRWGFTVLGEEGEAGSGETAAHGDGAEVQRWREFRFAFNREVKDVQGLENMFAEMRREIDEAVSTTE